MTSSVCASLHNELDFESMESIFGSTEDYFSLLPRSKQAALQLESYLSRHQTAERPTTRRTRALASQQQHERSPQAPLLLGTTVSIYSVVLKMKSAVLASLIASAAAFAPAQNGGTFGS